MYEQVSVLVLPPVLGPIPANETLPTSKAAAMTNVVSAFFINSLLKKLGFFWYCVLMTLD
jgi:hypothetical protein